MTETEILIGLDSDLQWFLIVIAVLQVFTLGVVVAQAWRRWKGRNAGPQG